MSIATALSGLSGAADDLNVTGNNIANVNTTGFKGSRTEFAEVFAAGATTGSGVRLSSVKQEFSQGNIDFTGNSLDLALTGEGFFTLDDNGTLAYTRAGAFGVNRDGVVVNASGHRLQVYPALGNGQFNTGGLTEVRLLGDQNPPNATSEVDLGVNLSAGAPVPANGVFDPTDPLSFTHTTSSSIFDSLGTAHTASFYFIKDAAANVWQSRLYIDGDAVGGANALTFDGTGQLIAPASGIISFPAYVLSNGANDIVLDLDLQLTTQFGGEFGVNSLAQNGFASGRLSGIEIDVSGVVFTRFTNGQSEALGKIALASFQNPQGLGQVGDTNWVETFASGDALRGEAGTGSFGLIQSGALEASNVDLTNQLVSMITAQRNFQANAQVISTEDAITQTIINLR